MTFTVGDRVERDRSRPGALHSVAPSTTCYATRYRIDRDDGHATVYTPAAGALHATPPHAEPAR
jgi:hypothetical protein